MAEPKPIASTTLPVSARHRQESVGPGQAGRLVDEKGENGGQLHHRDHAMASGFCHEAAGTFLRRTVICLKVPPTLEQRCFLA
jgi:hypothetical protein